MREGRRAQGPAPTAGDSAVSHLPPRPAQQSQARLFSHLPQLQTKLLGGGPYRPSVPRVSLLAPSLPHPAFSFSLTIALTTQPSHPAFL